MGKINAKSPATSCIILGAGDILNYSALRKKIEPDSFIICADGGLKHCKNLSFMPNLIVGDLDSATDIPKNVDVIGLSPNKNYSDTYHAIEEAIKLGYRDILLSGMLGGRHDHSLANLQTMGGFSLSGINICMSDGVTDIYALSSKDNSPAVMMLDPLENCYFSLLSLVNKCDSVTIIGGEYPLDSYPLSSLEARAISNEFTGKPVEITLLNGVILIMVLPK